MRTLIVLLLLVACCHAETYTFGEGDDGFEMEFVTIGDPGNPPDARTTLPMGTVDYVYQIAKFETSCMMTRTARMAGAFDGSVQSNCSTYGENHPAHQEWTRAAAFVNWLNVSSGYSPAYNLEEVDFGSGFKLALWETVQPGYDPENPIRNALAKFVLPTRDEWHKAAYYDASTQAYNLWSTGNTEPGMLGPEGGTEPNTAVYGPTAIRGLADLAEVNQAGGLSAYGVMGQTGNHGEWEEGSFSVDFPLGSRAYRTGAQDTVVAGQINAISSRQDDVIIGIWGFRVVAVTPVPEPSSLTLLAFVLCSLGAFRRRR